MKIGKIKRRVTNLPRPIRIPSQSPVKAPTQPTLIPIVITPDKKGATQ